MEIKDIKQIYKWLDEGHTGSEIAKFTMINPDIIDKIMELKKADVNLEIYA